MPIYLNENFTTVIVSGAMTYSHPWTVFFTCRSLAGGRLRPLSNVMPSSRYKHIIWDWNGTLLDDAWLCVDIMNGILRRRGMAEISVDTYRTHFDFPVRRYYEFLGFGADDTFEIVSHEFIGGITERAMEGKLHPGAADMLDRLHRAGVEQVILSAHHQQSLEAVVAAYGLRPYFDKLIGLDNIYAVSKVVNGLEHRATLPHAPHEVLLIGDTLHDAEVAEAIGADCLLVSAGHQSVERLNKASCPVVDSLADMAAFLHMD